MKTTMLAISLSISISSACASSWDNTFPAFPTLGTGQAISEIFYLQTSQIQRLYVAVNDDSTGVPEARLYELNGNTWSQVPNSKVWGSIYALSGAGSSQGSRLFVGGQFDSVGPTQVAATNIAMLNPIPTNNPSWTSLGTGAANGADAGVYCIKALNWSDNYLSHVYDRIMVYVGGQFTNAGGLTSPSIASWNGLGYLGSGWSRIGSASGGYGVDNDQSYRNMFGIATDTSVITYQTYLNALYLAGSFRKTIGSVVNYDIAKWNSSSWRNLGKGVQKGGLDNCAISFNPYPSYQGNCAVFTSSIAYVGGFFDDIQDKGATNHFVGFDNGCGCSVCGFRQLSTAKVGSNETLLAGGANFYLNGPAICMALMGTTPYVGGTFSNDDGTQVFYAAKLVSGSWTSLPVNSGYSPEDMAIAVTADASSVYYATAHGVFRYLP